MRVFVYIAPKVRRTAQCFNSIRFRNGFLQSLCLTSLAAVMLRASSEDMRGRVMGMRMLAIWGLPLGLLAAGPLIAHFGFPVTAALFCAFGLVFTVVITYCWRRHLWHGDAAANQRH